MCGGAHSSVHGSLVNPADIGDIAIALPGYRCRRLPLCVTELAVGWTTLFVVTVGSGVRARGLSAQALHWKQQRPATTGN